MTTPEHALRAVQHFVAQNRPYCRVDELLEDEQDYFAVLALNDPNGQWPLGPGPIFVSKATSKVWSDAYGRVLDKIDGMRAVLPPSEEAEARQPPRGEALASTCGPSAPGPTVPVMTTPGPNLGRLALVPPREVWPHEALNFTPWLLANADVLSDLLGMDLDLEIAEHPVGDFSLDLLGRDNATGQVVIVENQLETSDHLHLGQILTYAAGTEPTTIVWVAPTFRPEHRAALDWLNNRTDENTRFFGVEINVVRIGNSEPAPMFKLIAQPNDWAKTVRSSTNASEGLTERQQQYQRFWGRAMEVIQRERPGWSKGTTPPRDSWYSMTTGVKGATYYMWFTKAGLASQLWFESRDAAVNDERLHALLARKDEAVAAYGRPLDFEDLPGKKSTRVGEVLAGALITDESRWDEYIAWLVDRQTRLRDTVAAVGGVPIIAEPHAQPGLE